LGLAFVLLSVALSAPAPVPSSADAPKSDVPKADAPKPTVTKVAVSELEAGYGGDPKLAHTLSALLTGELRKRSGLAITSQQDIKNLLGFQREKQALACADTTCLSEIGGALGVDQIVTGSLGHVGETYLLDLRAIDVKHAVVLHEASRQLKTTAQDALIDAIFALSEELYPLGPKAAPSPAPEAAVSAPEPEPKHKHLVGPIVVGASGVAAALVGALLVYNAGVRGNHQTYGTENVYGVTYAQAQTLNTQATIGGTLFIAGLVAGVCGLGWGLFQ
jgi:hypothetical protein